MSLTRPVWNLLGALAVALAIASPAAAASWAPVAGAVPGSPRAAVADGPRTLVLSLVGGRNVTVTTIASGRVARLQALVHTRRSGEARNLLMTALPGGRALAVWQQGAGLRSSFRPSASARFGAPRAVAAIPGATIATAVSPSLAVTPAGEAIVAWWGGPAGGRLGIYVSALRGGGRWAPAVEASAGTYPQEAFVSSPICVSAAASADGGFAVAWCRPTSGATAIDGAVRPAGGTAWSTPTTLGSGAVAPGIAAASPRSAELVAAWDEGRDRRPDGVDARRCAVAATLTPAGTVARRDLECRDQTGSGTLRAVATAGGGVLAAWSTPPPSFPASTIGTITTYARAAGAVDWAPGVPAATGVRGMLDLSRASRGRSLLLADVTVTQTPTRAQAVLSGADGAVQRRLPGPPGRTTGRQGISGFGLGTGASAAILLRTLPSDTTRSCASILRLSTRP